jgi:DNA-binding transcriptional LysR family regulator
MASPLPDWDHYRSFREVVRKGSLSQAARALGLTQPTLGRHIAALESRLGARLFTRSQRGLHPTQAARELLRHADEMAGAAEAFVRAASGEAERAQGTVRVTASQFVGAEVLPPILADFRDHNPRIVIELALSDRNEDLLRRHADIAVRMVRPSQSALVARKIGMVRIGLFAHRRYLDAHGMPRNVAALADHAMIGFDRDDSAMRAMAGARALPGREAFAFRSDSDLAQLAALRAGFGIGGCQVAIARRDPNLVPVLPGEIGFALEMWLAMHEDLRGSRRIALLFDHLAGALKTYVAQSPRATPQGAGKPRKSKALKGVDSG